MDSYLAELTTEGVNPRTSNIDECSTEEMLLMMNREDETVAAAVRQEIPNIARAVELICASFKKGGRMIYVGCGTSGRLGVLDASECPPTFGVSDEMVQGFIAGGDSAIRNAIEGGEDNGDAGRELMNKLQIGEKDTIVGISASGSAAYVLYALEEAKKRGASTISVSTNKGSKMEKFSDVAIEAVVGPEVIMGSTRLKSGTAQKMILNMLTTVSMIKIGKVYNNLMVDMQASNIKLYDRSIRIICAATGTDGETAAKYLKDANMSVKLAIMMLRSGLDSSEAEVILDRFEGRLKDAINSVS